MLCLSAWTPNFFLFSTTSAQCWAPLYGISREYWRPKILFEISRSLGVPITMNIVISKRTLCHFVSVLIDVDSMGNLND